MFNKQVNPSQKTTPFQSRFRLPIEYLPSQYIHEIPPHVMEDLELCQTTDASLVPMHSHLFQPTHSFAQELLSRWANKITSQVQYLKETQHILRSFQVFQYSPEAETSSCTQFWKDVKEDPEFLQKYSYMEFDIVKKFNESATFLQSISTISIVSPIASILTPILFFIIPFVILRMKNIPLTMNVYFDILKDIAKNHVIGKSLQSCQNLEWNKVGYLLASVGLYFFQIYGNFINAMHFYTHIQKINQQLLLLKNFTAKMTTLMNIFFQRHSNKKTYTQFCFDVKTQCSVLEQIRDMVSDVQPFAFNLQTFQNLGYMLKCYYLLHDRTAYGEAVEYAFKFEGYMNNLYGVYNNWRNGTISFAKFNTKKDGLKIVKQHYPAIAKKDAVKNTCIFQAGGGGMIVTGPNASGKTTYLKNTAINIIMTQQVGGGYYSKCVLRPFTNIHSYLNIPDTSGRDSLFQAESRRCKEIITQLNQDDFDAHHSSRHFCIFDELFSGTNPRDATKAGYSFLLFLSKFKNVNFILTTHYIDICNKIEENEFQNIRNYQMGIDMDLEGGMKYLYSLKKGISRIEGAKKILVDLEYPDEIIESMDS
jgi:hypothetical protein